MGVPVPANWQSAIKAGNTYFQGRDAADPNNIGANWTSGVGGYLGGPDAFRQWTERQWQMFGRNYKFPIWVAGNAGEPEALAALRRCYYLGIPPGSVIIADMETRIDRTYLANFGAVMQHFGYKVWVYGSASTVFENPQLNGYAVADWTGEEFMYPHPGVRLTQYANEVKAGFDEFCVKDWPEATGIIWR